MASWKNFVVDMDSLRLLYILLFGGFVCKTKKEKRMVFSLYPLCDVQWSGHNWL